MILVFVLIFLLMVISIQQSMITSYSSQKVIENRVTSMLEFHNSIVLDSQKSVSIIGKRAISAATNYIVASGKPLSAANVTIVELISSGTINGVSQALMNGSTINDWQNSVTGVGAVEGFDVKVNVSNITVQPEDSFDLLVTFTITDNISDSISQANLSKSSLEYSIVNIVNSEDPLYPLNTYGRIVSIIQTSPHWMNYSNTDPTNLLDDYTNSYYHPSLYGASFLDRLEGQYTVQSKYAKNVPIGLERFVNKDTINSVGLSTSTSLTNIDYLYFAGSSVAAYNVTGMPSNFRIDNQTTINSYTHLQIYNVTVSP